MKRTNQFRKCRLPINNVWEVRLDIDLWNRIKRAAISRRCTYSWITRYCVFRLIRRERGVLIKAGMEKHIRHKNAQNLSRKHIHRHLICLYGEDEKLLRLAALQYNMTISGLIRLAMELFLSGVECYKVKWHHIFYHGTKICRFLDCTTYNIHQLPFVKHYFIWKWPREFWWQIPRYSVPIPFTPEELN